MNDKIGVQGFARLQVIDNPKWVQLAIRFLQIFNIGHIGAQTIGKLINKLALSGELIADTGWGHNTITTASYAVFSGLAGNIGVQAPFTFLAVGSDSTAESAAHTTLIAEIVTSDMARAAAAVTRSTTTNTNDTLQLDKTWSVTTTNNVKEIGVFNAASSGVMAGRKLTGTIAVVSGNSLVSTYKIKFG